MNKLYLAGLLLVVVIGVYVGFRKADNGPQGMACTMGCQDVSGWIICGEDWARLRICSVSDVDYVKI